MTPLLDFQAVLGALDPDQQRTEETLSGEALANKEESKEALRYSLGQLIGLPLLAGFVMGRALADQLSVNVEVHLQRAAAESAEVVVNGDDVLPGAVGTYGTVSFIEGIAAAAGEEPVLLT